MGCDPAQGQFKVLPRKPHVVWGDVISTFPGKSEKTTCCMGDVISTFPVSPRKPDQPKYILRISLETVFHLR